MKSNSKGITLIALVITIIVLLILAGVTIATLTGDNGILTKAQNAKTQNDKVTVKEKVDLGVGELETLQSVMDEIKAMNKEYASYSGAPEGATVTSRYVFRTKEESSK